MEPVHRGPFAGDPLRFLARAVLIPMPLRLRRVRAHYPFAASCSRQLKLFLFVILLYYGHARRLNAEPLRVLTSRYAAGALSRLWRRGVPSTRHWCGGNRARRALTRSPTNLRGGVRTHHRRQIHRAEAQYSRRTSRFLKENFVLVMSKIVVSGVPRNRLSPGTANDSLGP